MTALPIPRSGYRDPSRQEPTRHRRLYWSDRRSGWWPGLPTRCTPACGGRLDATPQNTPTDGPGVVFCLSCGRELPIDVLDVRPPFVRPLTPEEARPNNVGRPPKMIAAPDPPKPKPEPEPAATAPRPTPQPEPPPRPREDCGAMVRGRRCRSCAHEAQKKWPALVGILSDGIPRRANDICVELGVSYGSLRQFVIRARRAGHPIRSGMPFGTYRLEREGGLS